MSDRQQLTISQWIATCLALVVLGVIPLAIALAPTFSLGFRVAGLAWFFVVATAATRPTQACFPFPVFSRVCLAVAFASCFAECLRQFPPVNARYIDDYVMLAVWLACGVAATRVRRPQPWMRGIAVTLFLGSWAAAFFYDVSGGIAGMFLALLVVLHMVAIEPRLAGFFELSDEGQEDAADAPTDDQPAESALLETAISAAGGTVSFFAVWLTSVRGDAPRWIRLLVGLIQDGWG